MRALILISLLFITLSCAKQEPLSVVVVGGGPVGLSAALEAVDAGALVTVIEKREVRGRRQRVFLSENSIQLLEGWRIALPEDAVLGSDGERIAIIAIHVLEELLEARAVQKGVRMLQAEFRELCPGKQICIRSGQKMQNLDYDLLIAADGAHSALRQALGISLDNLGSAEGALAWLQLSSGSAGFSITDPITTESGFIRRIQSGSGTIIFSQGPVQGVDELIDATLEQGWESEAQMIREEKGNIAGGIPLFLQQAKRFSAPEMSAIVLGDAAAAGSFFQGLGLNVGLETVSVAGRLIRQLQSSDNALYTSFEDRMRETTDVLINENRFLFERDAAPAI